MAQAFLSNAEPRKALVALGSNLPVEGQAPRVVLDRAIAQLRDYVTAQGGGDFKLSQLYRTPVFPAGSGPDFVNAAISFDWPLDPNSLLEKLHAIEADFGRSRSQRWAARGLDLDLLGLGNLVLPDPDTWQVWANLSTKEAQSRAPDQLILPHPRMAERGFVLIPLCDVAPNWCHPILGETVSQLRAKLPLEECREINPL